MAVDFNLPELGETIETIQVTNVRVSIGDSIAEEQPLFELETDKATIDVPSTVTGVVKEILVKEGDEVSVGQTLLRVESEADSPATGGAGSDAEPSDPTPEQPAPKPEKTPPEKTEPAPEPEPEPGHAGNNPPEEPQAAPEASKTTEARSGSGGGATPYHVPAAPAVRTFAREIGVDVDAVQGSGPKGRVSIDDVKRYAREQQSRRSAGGDSGEGFSALNPPPLPDPESFGPVTRERMSVIRRKTAEHMALSWAVVPHVTIHEQADVTELDRLRKKHAGRAESQGGKLTLAVMVCKAAASALKLYPRFNASVDLAGREIILKSYIHLGVAVNTDRGLVVPVIRNADRKNLVRIAVEISRIAEKARLGKIELSDLEGGTFTVTNLGRVAGRYFTPIVNYPEVAILGIGRGFQETVLEEGTPKTRTRLPLSLSFDHRVIDGADGAEFLRWIIDALEEPLLLSMEG